MDFSDCKKKHKDADEKIDVLGDTTKPKTNPDGTPVANLKNQAGNRVNPAYQEQTVTVSGYIRGAGNANIILDELEIGGINPLESVVVNPDGSFSVSTTINEPGIYQLRLPNGSIHLFLRGGQVKVTGDISNLSKYEISGSVESMHLRQMYYVLDKFNDRTYAIQDRMNALEKDKTRTKELLRMYDSLDIYYEKIKKDKSVDLKKFIQQIDTSMVALLAGFYLDPDLNHAFLVQLLKKFKTVCPDSKYYTKLEEKVKNVIPTSSGDPAPVITLKDVNGKPVSLSSFTGKNLLMYFWCSDDEACMRVNKKLKVIYDKYKSQGFEIYAISLDSKKQEWLNAIKEDNIKCVHVSNLAGRDDDLMKIYTIGTLPYMFLLNRKGIIVDKGFTISQLEAKIRQLQ